MAELSPDELDLWAAFVAAGISGKDAMLAEIVTVTGRAVDNPGDLTGDEIQAVCDHLAATQAGGE